MTDYNLDEFDFGSSAGAKVAKEANKSGEFAREIEYLTLKADEASVAQGNNQAIIRVVTEFNRQPVWDGHPTTPWNQAWITVQQHYAPTKQRPEYVEEGRSWPAKMSAICRKDKIFAKRFGGQCHLCDVVQNKPSARTWALAVEREEVIDNGRIVGYRDKTREVFAHDDKGELIVIGEKDGKKQYQKKTVPAWLVLNFGWKNFFANLDAQGNYFKTVLDRDFVVQRSGTGNNDTVYTFIPLAPIPITGEWAQSLGVPEGTPYDLGHILGDVDGHPVNLMQIVYPDMPDLRRVLLGKVDDDYYGRYFVPGWLPEGFDPSKAKGQGQNVQSGVQSGYTPQGGVQQPAAPATPAPASSGSSAPPADALAALRARVTGGAPAQQG